VSRGDAEWPPQGECPLRKEAGRGVCFNISIYSINFPVVFSVGVLSKLKASTSLAIRGDFTIEERSYRTGWCSAIRKNETLRPDVWIGITNLSSSSNWVRDHAMGFGPRFFDE